MIHGVLGKYFYEPVCADATFVDKIPTKRNPAKNNLTAVWYTISPSLVDCPEVICREPHVYF